MEGASSTAFQEFLSEATQQAPGLVRSLQEVVKVQEGYEWAIDVALGQFARSLVAGDVTTARTLVERLSAKHSLAIGIFLKTQTSCSPEASRHYASFGFRPLADFVQIEFGFEGILGNVFISETFPLHQL